MKRCKYVGIVAAVVVAGLIAVFAGLLHGRQIDVLNPSGIVADQQRSILLFTISLSLLVVVPVFTMLIFFSVRYREGNKKAAYRPEWAENKFLETLWWGIPILIIGVLGVITWQTSHSLDPYKSLSGGKPLEVQVVALQWKWLFIYPEQQVATLNYMPAPINRPIHFSLTADAPMSAFWIPALGTQIYAMNGMESQLNLKPNKLGDFVGYTTNINGKGYSDMKFKARIMNDKDFDKWITDARSSPHRIDMAYYKQLAEPKSQTDEVTYRLTDRNLFDTILAQHMSHGSTSSSSKHQMDHSKMEMQP